MKLRIIVSSLLFGAMLGAAPIEAGWGWKNLQPTVTLQTLDDIEETTLLFMREEEKMARDVYLQLFDLWNNRVFDNIAASEQHHMDAMKRLIDGYGLTDPVIDDTPGAFTDQTLGALHDELVETGSQSLEAALRVGALIEEIDILDLESAIAETDNDDIIQAYQKLLRGSRNHLRAFVRQLESLGVVYEAQRMDQAELDAIVNSPMERGGRPGKGRGQGCRGMGCRF